MTEQEYLQEVSLAYALAPIVGPGAARAWQSLADHTMATYERLARALDVVPVATSEPYRTMVDMARDVGQGRILVSDVNHEHPLWTPEVNRAFRVVHDVVGHCTTGAGFDWRGELRAWAKHETLVECPHAKSALFCEAAGQVAYALDNGGEFGPQKCAILDQWLEWAYPPAWTGLGVAA
jgi:hypothetical protein